MALRDDIANDFEAFDNVETASVEFKPAGTIVATAKLLVGPLDRKAMAVFDGLELEVDDVVATLWVSTLGGNELHSADVVTRANGRIYKVMGCRLVTLETRYQAILRRVP